MATHGTPPTPGTPVVFLNGRFLPKSEAQVSVEDRGFIFGDGVYEVWRVINGQLFEHERHVARLHRGLGELRIEQPADASSSCLLEIAQRLIADNGLSKSEGLLYLQITRGAAPRMHAFPTPAGEPTMFMMANPFAVPADQRKNGAVATLVPDVRWHRCNVKTLQLLPNVMAMQAAVEAGAAEAILVRDGVITEGAHSNVMAVVGGVIRTHPANELVLPGVTRSVVLELAREAGIPVEERAITKDELSRVDELFLTGTGSDVTAVVRVDDLTIGNGTPGPLTQRLADLLQAKMYPARRAAAR